MILKKAFLVLLALAVALAGYFAVALNWSYSTGERAGWIQKLSNKGWLCKTWEGELALVSLPGSATVEKFQFTVRDDAVAAELAKVMGKRVTLHYEEKVGLPTRAGVFYSALCREFRTAIPADQLSFSLAQLAQ